MSTAHEASTAVKGATRQDLNRGSNNESPFLIGKGSHPLAWLWYAGTAPACQRSKEFLEAMRPRDKHGA